MTGTYARHKTNEGQIRPLEARMSEKQYERRTARIATRVGREGAITRGYAMQLGAILGRGFFGRMKWLFLGR